MISTCAIAHPCLDMSVIKYIGDIQSSTLNKEQSRQALKKPIFISDTDCYYILDEIMCHDHTVYERQIHNDKISEL